MANPEQCARGAARGLYAKKPSGTEKDLRREYQDFITTMLTTDGVERGGMWTVYSYFKKRNVRLGPRTQSNASYVHRASLATLYRWWGHVLGMPASSRLTSVAPKNGRPYSLPSVLEQSAKQRVQALVNDGGVVTRAQVRNELLFTALTKLPGESDADVAQRFSRVGGPCHVRDFLKVHKFSSISNGRPIEVERAMKYQPEYVVDHFRLILHCHAVCQLQRAIAADPSLSSRTGWILPVDGTVHRQSTGNGDCGDDLLAVKNGLFWLIPLDCALEFVNPSRIWNCDEKPVVLRNPVRSATAAPSAMSPTGAVPTARSPST
jgi:hypothetical protein